MDKIKLKPCPFCGSEVGMTDGVYGQITMVVCKNYRRCGATVSFDVTENPSRYYGNNKDAEIAHLWNRRNGEYDD